MSWPCKKLGPAFRLDAAKQNSRLDVLFGIEVGQKDDGLTSFFRTQGEFFHLLSVERNRKIEDDVPNPVATFLLFGVQIDPLNESPHELLFLGFTGGTVHLIKGQ